MLIPLLFFAALTLIILRQIPDAYARFRVWQRLRRMKRIARERREQQEFRALVNAALLFGGAVADSLFAYHRTMNSGHYAPQPEPIHHPDMAGSRIRLFEQLRKNAEEAEEYEEAARIRDEINRLRTNTNTL